MWYRVCQIVSSFNIYRFHSTRCNNKTLAIQELYRERRRLRTKLAFDIIENQTSCKPKIYHKVQLLHIFTYPLGLKMHSFVIGKGYFRGCFRYSFTSSISYLLIFYISSSICPSFVHGDSVGAEK